MCASASSDRPNRRSVRNANARNWMLLVGGILPTFVSYSVTLCMSLAWAPALQRKRYCLPPTHISGHTHIIHSSSRLSDQTNTLDSTGRSPRSSWSSVTFPDQSPWSLVSISRIIDVKMQHALFMLLMVLRLLVGEAMSCALVMAQQSIA